MWKFPTGLLMAAVLAASLATLAIEQACATPAGTGQAAPQGKDPPGADDDGNTPPAEQNGVIKPPPTGDEGIHTEVPNPNAGPGDEIIPPSELPGAQNAEPK